MFQAGRDPGHEFGAIAQLGERLLCKQDVRSSILLGSTNSLSPPRGRARECLRNGRLAQMSGYARWMDAVMPAPVLPRTRPFRRRRAKGVTLLELAMYLGIAGIIASGVMMYYSSANRAQRVQAAAGMVVTLRSTVATLFQGQSSYSGLTTDLLVASPTVPRTWKKAGMTDRLVTPLGTTLTVDESSIDPGYVNVAFRDLPEGVCNALVLQRWENLVDIRTDHGPFAIPPTPASAKTACDGGVQRLSMTFR